MTIFLTVALYLSFIVWGNPDDSFVEETDEPMLTIRTAGATPSYDRPTILLPGQQLAAVTRALPAAPEPSAVAAAAPAPGFADPGRLGEPVVVSLVHESLLDAPTEETEVQTVAASEGPLMRVTGSRVNMRAGPSVGNPVVDSLTEGTITEALGQPQDGWVEIRDVSTGLVGYMSANFLEPV
ncbi:MAG: SH3 domain-containing protein [Pseudomonadota bacterium]